LVLELAGIKAGFLIFVRVSSFMMLAPFFSIKGPPVIVRTGLGALLTLAILPSFEVLPTVTDDLLAYSFLVIKEVLVGLIIGYASMLVFSAVRVAGEFIDIQMGFAMAAVFDPQYQSRITLVGQYLYILAILLFLVMDGHHSLILAISHSYAVIPIGAAIFDKPLVVCIIQMFVDVFSLGVRIAAPFVAVLVICDICLGLLARTVPQLNVFILGFPLKAGIGMVALGAALPILIIIVSGVLQQMQRDMLLIMEIVAR
jgi:flagellar biosynthetic protein FliR